MLTDGVQFPSARFPFNHHSKPSEGVVDGAEKASRIDEGTDQLINIVTYATTILTSETKPLHQTRQFKYQRIGQDIISASLEHPSTFRFLW